MTITSLIALIGFALISSITPGPNNFMVLASSANFGLRRTMPHILGVTVGFSVMVMIVGISLATLFATMPALQAILKIVSVTYMLYLAWKIATAAPLSDETGVVGKPFTFLQAAAFQWVNPKGWTSALAGTAAYAPEGTFVGEATVSLAFFLVGLPSLIFWAALGQQLRRYLTRESDMRIFNTVMAALLILTLVPIVA